MSLHRRGCHRHRHQRRCHSSSLPLLVFSLAIPKPPQRSFDPASGGIKGARGAGANALSCFSCACVYEGRPPSPKGSSGGTGPELRIPLASARAISPPAYLVKVVRGLAARIGRNHQGQAAARAPGFCLGLELADHDDRIGRDECVDASLPGVLDQRAVPVCVDPAARPQRRHSTRRDLAAYRRFGAGLLVFQGMPAPATVSLKAVLAVLYNGLLGTGFAYILWFAIIERLPTATASLGSLSTPVVGIISSMLMLGERPTTEDMIGFALIFAAAACLLTQPAQRTVAQAP